MYQSRGNPRITSGNTHARDITEEFTKAASRLETGQLVKDEFFTLFEAVGALEIMDSKMDSGYLAPGDTLDDKYDVMRELLPEEVVGIMDQLLWLEVAWHMGHPLSQTLFTSLYLDRLLWPIPATLDGAQFTRRTQETRSEPEVSEGMQHGKGELTDPGLVSIVLRAYCLALVKACDRVIGRVSSEYYFEEEDLVTQLYNRNMLSDVESSEIHALLDNAISWLTDNARGMESSFVEALSTRLLFRQEFLSTLELDTSVIQSRETENSQACLDLIDAIESSMHLGKPVEESFSCKIQRRLATTVPPRPMVKINIADAISFLRRFFKDVIDVQGVLDTQGSYDLLKSVWALQSRDPQPSVYVRSLTQSFLLNEMRVLGVKSIKQFCYEDLTDLVLPWSTLLDKKNEEVEMPSDPRFQIAQHMDTFTKRVAQPFIDTYRTLCLNRCRIRRTVCHSIIDWDHLQVEAEELDVHLRGLTSEPAIHLHGDEPTYAYPLSSWVYHQKLRQLRLLLQLGFELSIYSPEELSGLYWYLSHVCGTHLAHLDRIRSCVEAEYHRDAGRNSLDRKTAFDRTFKVLHRHSTELIAIDALAIALNALYTLLSRYKLLPSAYLASPRHYSSEKLRYELRMKPFFSVSLPDSIAFELFEQEAGLLGNDDEMVLERAVLAVAEAKKGLEQCLREGPFMDNKNTQTTTEKEHNKEKLAAPSSLAEDWTTDFRNSLRACIATSIAIGTFKRVFTANKSSFLTKAGSKNTHPGTASRRLNLSVEIPEIGSKGRWHNWWAVPKISEILPVRTGAQAVKNRSTEN